MGTKKRASKKSAAKSSTNKPAAKRPSKRKTKPAIERAAHAPVTQLQLASAVDTVRREMHGMLDRTGLPQSEPGLRIEYYNAETGATQPISPRTKLAAAAGDKATTIFDTVNRITNVAHDVEARSFNLADSLQVPNGENGIAAAGQSQTSAPQPAQPSLTHQLSRIELALERINHNMNKIAEMYVG